MDTTFSKEDLEFQQEVRTFIKENYPQWLRDAIKEKTRTGQEFTKDEVTAWHKILGKHKGWSVPGWSTEYGGPGFTATQKYIFQEEMAKQDTLMVAPFGPVMCAPVIMTFGSAEQKEKFLPRILSGEDFWCQGYSEPNAGSDLASLKTEAVLSEDGTHYIVNGQKTWTTMAQHADWIFCLVRTDPNAAKHDGISFVLIDMASEGVSTKPIELISGASPFCETFFDNVRVPVSNRIHEENKGWSVAKALLLHERTMLAETSRGAGNVQERRSLLQVARDAVEQHEGVIADTSMRNEIAQTQMDTMCYEATLQRTMEAAKAGQGMGPEGSMFKLYLSELNQRKADLRQRMNGANSLIWDGEDFNQEDKEITREWLYGKASTILGGTSEIQLNIISKRVLGLPD